MEGEAATQGDQSTDTESVIIQPDLDPPSTCPDEPDCAEPKINLNQGEIFKALEIVERDSLAIAAGSLQESVLDAATKGNRYINSCMRLNEEMKDIDTLATQLKILRRNIDVLDSAVNKLLRFP